MKFLRVVLKKQVTAVLAAAALAVLPGAAQGPAGQGPDSKQVSVSKVERKNKAPVSKEVLRVKLPKPAEFTLDNGLRVLILEDHRLPTVTVRLEISGAGGLYEPETLRGVAQITAQMLSEGTKTRTSKQIAEESDRLGAQLSAGSGFGTDAAVLSGSGLSDNFDAWFALGADVLLHPGFPADELKRLVERQKAQLRPARAQPGFLITERFNRAVYGAHPASTIAATPESLDALTPEALAKWHQERYAPQNAILGISGDVRPAEVLPKLKQWLGGWPKSTQAATLPADPTPTVARRIHLVDRPGSVQTTLAMGNIAITRTDPDYFAMLVLNRIFGQGPAARLFLNLREEKGYTYGVYSQFAPGKYRTAWRAGGDLRSEVTEGAMTEFLKEINRIRDEKVPAQELEEAKSSVVSSFALSLEQPAQLLSFALTRVIYNLPADYWDTYPAKVMAITADDVQRVARKYLDPNTMQVAAVGDAGKIKAVLEKFGPVQVYDAEGRPVADKAASAAAPGR